MLIILTLFIHVDHYYIMQVNYYHYYYSYYLYYSYSYSYSYYYYCVFFAIIYYIFNAAEQKHIQHGGSDFVTGHVTI